MQASGRMARRYRHWPPASLAILLVVGALYAWQAWNNGSSPLLHEPAGVDDRPSPPTTTVDSPAHEGGLRAGVCELLRVVDGDTLLVTQTNESDQANRLRPRYRVRLLGIDTPETVKEGTPVQPYGPEATQFTRDYLKRGPLRLEFDKRRMDRFDRYLAYAYVGDDFLSLEIVRAGLARIESFPGDSQAVLRQLKEAQREARDKRRGIWSETP